MQADSNEPHIVLFSCVFTFKHLLFLQLHGLCVVTVGGVLFDGFVACVALEVVGAVFVPFDATAEWEGAPLVLGIGAGKEEEEEERVEEERFASRRDLERESLRDTVDGLGLATDPVEVVCSTVAEISKDCFLFT